MSGKRLRRLRGGVPPLYSAAFAKLQLNVTLSVSQWLMDAHSIASANSGS